MIKAEKLKGISLSGNQLKVIAALAMTIDHIGVQIFTDISLLRIIGRLAFPIFAYMIAEGCLYTKNRKKYILTMALLAIGCQVVGYIFSKTLYQCILVTFSLSILLIYAYSGAVKKGTAKSYAVLLLALLGTFFLTEVLPQVLKHTDYAVDYGFWGVMLPLFAYIGADKKQKLFYFAAGVLLVAASFGGLQWFSLITIPILALYSGKRGKIKMKKFFYIYYPVHLAAIYLISYII